MKRKYRIVSVEKFNEEILEIAKNGCYRVYISKRMLHEILADPHPSFNIHFMRFTHKIYTDRPECDGLYLDSTTLEIKRIIQNGELYELCFNLKVTMLGDKNIFYV